MSPRSLRRHLDAEGLSFEAVRDDVRFTVARELLEMTHLPIGEISAALAFASHSAFDQAFRRWSGTSPTAWRRGQTGLFLVGGEGQ
jgi:AraC-like DNA-binding protein